jgi:hypothetical protein
VPDDPVTCVTLMALVTTDHDRGSRVWCMTHAPDSMHIVHILAAEIGAAEEVVRGLIFGDRVALGATLSVVCAGPYGHGDAPKSSGIWPHVPKCILGHGRARGRWAMRL